MKFQPTRPQVHREFIYFRLYARSFPARVRSAVVAHRKAIILMAGASLFLLALCVALIQATADSPDGGNREPESPSATQSIPVPLSPEPPIIPVPLPVPEPAPPNQPAAGGRFRIVAAGETLADIALRYGVPSEQIAADNAITDPNRIRPGDRLLITGCPAGVEVIALGATLTSAARTFKVTVKRLRKLNPQITNPNRLVAGRGLRVRQP